AATPMWRCFALTPDTTPFRSRPANVDLDEKNRVDNAWSRKSQRFDFSREDRAPDIEFSEVIWKAVKGEHSQMPAPRRAAFLRTSSEK
ncbi:MAG: hypothetical protein EBZ67_01345, partial [Chitinophagia bacterium]|nr:hypothetical protein [Chitinophagia bacterium]